MDVWQGMLQYALDDAIDEWRKRLRTCIRAKGGHFLAYAVTANSASITSFISCCLLSHGFLYRSVLKLNIFNRAHSQALH